MVLSRIIGLLILCALAVLVFLFVFRSVVFKSLKGSERSVKAVTVIVTHLTVTAIVFGFCMAVWFGILLLVG